MVSSLQVNSSHSNAWYYVTTCKLRGFFAPHQFQKRTVYLVSGIFILKNERGVAFLPTQDRLTHPIRNHTFPPRPHPRPHPRHRRRPH